MQKVQIHIAEPCHESWQQMTPTEQGRFCQACTKEVIDFSVMTDAEILDYLARHQQGKICGRVAVSQLQREIVRPGTAKKKIYWYWNYMMASLLLFTKQVNGRPVQVNRILPAVVTPQVSKQNPVLQTLPVNPSGPLMVSGKVLDQDNKPVPFASVYLKGSKTGVSANAAGEFSLMARTDGLLVISAVGFKPVEILIAGQSYIVAHCTQEESAVLGGISAGVIVKAPCGYNYDDNTIGTVPIRNHVAVFSVKDSATGKPLPHAGFVFQKNWSEDSVSGTTDSKGLFKIKRVKKDDSYAVRVSLPGYESNEFSLTGDEFDERKGSWDVFLKKQNPPTAVEALRNSTKVMMGGISAFVPANKPLFVVDGTIVADAGNISSDNIVKVEVLQGPAASALFGAEGSGGAILITTKENKIIKSLDTVRVFDSLKRRIIRCGTTCTTYIERMLIPAQAVTGSKAQQEKAAQEKALLCYPNPVSKGGMVNLDAPAGINSPVMMRVLNTAGVPLLEWRVENMSKNKTIQFVINSSWAGGLYYVTLSGTDGKTLLKGSFIVQ